MQRDGAPLLRGSRAQRAQQLPGAALQGQEADAEGVDLPQHGLPGEAAVEDQLLGVGAGRVGEEERTVGGALELGEEVAEGTGGIVELGGGGDGEAVDKVGAGGFVLAVGRIWGTRRKRGIAG